MTNLLDIDIKKRIFLQKLLSLLEHTRVGLADYSKWQARRSGYARHDQRSDRGVRDIHRKYAECGTRSGTAKGGITRKLNKNCPYFAGYASRGIFLLLENSLHR